LQRAHAPPARRGRRQSGRGSPRRRRSVSPRRRISETSIRFRSERPVLSEPHTRTDPSVSTAASSRIRARPQHPLQPRPVTAPTQPLRGSAHRRHGAEDSQHASPGQPRTTLSATIARVSSARFLPSADIRRWSGVARGGPRRASARSSQLGIPAGAGRHGRGAAVDDDGAEVEGVPPVGDRQVDRERIGILHGADSPVSGDSRAGRPREAGIGRSGPRFQQKTSPGRVPGRAITRTIRPPDPHHGPPGRSAAIAFSARYSWMKRAARSGGRWRRSRRCPRGRQQRGDDGRRKEDRTIVEANWERKIRPGRRGGLREFVGRSRGDGSRPRRRSARPRDRSEAPERRSAISLRCQSPMVRVLYVCGGRSGVEAPASPKQDI